MLSKIHYHIIVLLVSWIHTIVNENFDLTLCIGSGRGRTARIACHLPAGISNHTSRQNNITYNFFAISLFIVDSGVATGDKERGNYPSLHPSKNGS